MYPPPTSVKLVGSPEMLLPPRMTYASPRNAASVPSVTASDGRFKRPTSSPFTSPSVVATARPASPASQTLTPACQISAQQTAATVMFDATEMSISPAMTTNVRPKAISPMKTYGVARSSRFASPQEEARERPAPDTAGDDQEDEQQLPASERSSTRSGRRRSCLRTLLAGGEQIRPSLPSQGVLELLLEQRVDRDRDDDRGALEEDLPELGDVQRVKPLSIVATSSAPRVAPRTVPEPPNTLTPPITTAVTTSNSKPSPGDGVDGREPRSEHEAAQARQGAADRERGHHTPLRPDSGEPRSFGVGADRIEVPPPRSPAQHGAADERDAERDPGERREAGRLFGGKVEEPLRQLGRQDVLAAGDLEDDAAVDRERRQRRDDRRDLADATSRPLPMPQARPTAAASRATTTIGRPWWCASVLDET